jgi:hypothetical protein
MACYLLGVGEQFVLVHITQPSGLKYRNSILSNTQWFVACDKSAGGASHSTTNATCVHKYEIEYFSAPSLVFLCI